jgi:hypothetical protein
VKELADQATLTLGAATLRVFHTAGHAKHHFVVHDESTSTVFTGDAFGLVYPQLQRGRRLAFPSTSPIDFDGPEAHASIDRIVGLKPKAVALTHFGPFEDVTIIAGQLHRWIDSCQTAVEDCVRSGEVDCEGRLKRAVTSELERSASEAGLTFTADDWKLLAVDLDLNAQGLAYVVSRRLKPAT